MTRLLTQERMIALAGFLVVPMLYVIGQTYSTAWLRAAGLPVDAFSRGIEEALMYGYVALMTPVVGLVKYLPPMMGWVAAFLALWATLWCLMWATKHLDGIATRSINDLRHRLAWLERFERPELAIASKSFSAARFPFLMIAVLLYAMLLLVLPIFIGDHFGKRSGAEFIAGAKQRAVSGAYVAGDQIVVTAEGSGLLLQCGDRGCGYLKDNTVVFEQWDRIARIVQAKSK